MDDFKVSGGEISNSSSTVTVKGSASTTDTIEAMHSAMNAVSTIGGSNESFYMLSVTPHADGTSSVKVIVPKAN